MQSNIAAFCAEIASSLLFKGFLSFAILFPIIVITKGSRMTAFMALAPTLFVRKNQLKSDYEAKDLWQLKMSRSEKTYVIDQGFVRI